MHRFLIIQTAFIGDVVLATPLIGRLNDSYPDSSVDVLVRKGNEVLLAGHPGVNEVLIWDKKDSKYLNLLRTIFKVRKGRYDAVINLQRFASTGLIAGLSGAPWRSGFDRNPLSWLFTHKARHKIGKKGDVVFPHETERNLLLLEGLTISSEPKMRLYPREQDAAKIRSLLAVPFITISPVSVWYTKQYPAERWIEFIAQVSGYRIYLLGGPGDRAACESIQMRCAADADVINLAGELSFLESAALMERAVMNYCNDSGPLHFASAVNAPVTAVFCSTVPEFGFGPRSSVSFVVQSEQELSCRPCGLHGRSSCPEGHFACSHIAASALKNCLP